MSSLQIGYNRQDMTPDYSVPLAGYGNTRTRMSQGYYARIYATCIAFTDHRDCTVLLFATDQTRCRQEWTNEARRRITEQTGIPGERIMISASHSHSCPDIAAALTQDDPYFELYISALVTAAQNALADRAPLLQAEMTRLDIPGMNFVRHYVMEDGSVIGDNFGTAGGRKYVGHTIPGDPQMQLLRLTREGKKAVLLTNWQAHPTLTSTRSAETGPVMRTLLGPDYVGFLREYTEASADCLFAFFQGGAGNQNAFTRIPEEKITSNAFTYGQQLGRHLVGALESMTPIQLGEIKNCQKIYEGELDHSDDHMVDAARIIHNLWREKNNQELCKAEGAKYGIHSSYHASAILRRAAEGRTAPLELNALCVGDFAFITAPYEMFCNNAQFVKQNSPFQLTFVITCANNSANYVANDQAFVHGCYEVDNRNFIRGTAEKAADTFVEMLKHLQN